MKPNDSGANEAMTEEQLLVLLGSELAVSERALRLPSPAELVAKAQLWLQINMQYFQDAICTQTRVRKIVEHKDGELVAAIADLIASFCVGVSPVTVAYLLVRRGLKSLCKAYWEPRA
jgi:hypothetical protein